MKNTPLWTAFIGFCLALLELPGMAQMVIAPRIVINEINPSPKEPRSEFIELVNGDSETANLQGWRLTGGIEYTFPQIELHPNDYLVIAADPAFLTATFNIAPSLVRGPYVGQLKASGEELLIEDPMGNLVDQVNFSLGFPWPTGAYTSNGSLELIHSSLDNNLGGAWRINGCTNSSPNDLNSAMSTPGRQNSVYATQAPPMIEKVQHAPTEIFSGLPVRIMAEIIDPDGIADVILSYQVVEPGKYVCKGTDAYNNNWTKVKMQEEEGAYSVQLPPSMQKHRHLIRYRITATDRIGNSITVPYPDDEQSNFAYFCYDGVPGWKGSIQPGVLPEQEFPAELMAKALPVYHLLADANDVEQCKYTLATFEGTFVYDDVVYDHIRYRIRGTSNYLSGKNKWKIYFNKAKPLTAVDNYGRRYRRQIKELNLNACATAWLPINRGMAGLGSAFAFRLFQLTGVPASDTHWLHFRMITTAEESSATNQYDGDLLGLYLYEEDIDADFFKTRAHPDGNIFDISAGGLLPQASLRNQAYGQPSDGSDWVAFATASKLPQTENWWREHLDLSAYFNFQAVNRLISNLDLREDNNFLFYSNPNGTWSPIPWDMDAAFLPYLQHSGTIYQRACLDKPAISKEYKNRCRELIDLLCSDKRDYGGQACQLLEELARLVNPPGWDLTFVDVDQALWNYNPQTTAEHLGQFYVNPGYFAHVVRTLTSANHEGFEQYVKDFVTDTDRNSWSPNDGDQWGYGYNCLAFESADINIPQTPKLLYIGEQGFPLDALSFRCIGYPQNASEMRDQITMVKWRVGKISNPSTPMYQPSTPWEYEITPLWESEASLTNNTIFYPPPNIFKIGHTYRVRVKIKNVMDVWSHWSAPIEFVAGHNKTNTTVHDIVRINEWMANNQSTIQDPVDGDYEDWFELYNPSDIVVSLKDYRFSDQPVFSNAWSVPFNVDIKAGQFLIVWADGEVNQNQSGLALHVPFKLSADGDSIFAWSPDGKLVDEVHFERQEPNISTGRRPDGSDCIQRLDPYSPGNRNYENDSGEIWIIPFCQSLPPDLVQLRWSSVPGLRYTIETVDDTDTTHWRFFHDYGVATADEAVFTFKSDPGPKAYYLIKEITEFPKLMPLVLNDRRVALRWETVIGGLYQLEYQDDIRTKKWKPFLSQRTALSEIETINILPSKNVMQYYRVVRLR